MTKSVLIAGCEGLPSQHHQRDMWVPAALAAGLRPVSVWTPATSAEPDRTRAAELARSLELELVTSDDVPLAGVDGVIACLRGDHRRTLVRGAADAGTPVLLDKPTLDDTPSLEALAAERPHFRFVTGNHMRFHGGYAALAAAVSAGTLGLLRAVHADLVVAGGDGPSVDGEVRNLLVYHLDLVARLVGSAETVLQAHAVPAREGAGESWTVLGQTERRVVWSSHLTRTVHLDGIPGVLVNRLRVLGSHGFATVDLTRPGIEVISGAGVRPRGLGPSSVRRCVEELVRLMDGQRGDTVSFAETAALSRVLDAVAESAGTTAELTARW